MAAEGDPGELPSPEIAEDCRASLGAWALAVQAGTLLAQEVPTTVSPEVITSYLSRLRARVARVVTRCRLATRIDVMKRLCPALLAPLATLTIATTAWTGRGGTAMGAAARIDRAFLRDLQLDDILGMLASEVATWSVIVVAPRDNPAGDIHPAAPSNRAANHLRSMSLCRNSLTDRYDNLR